MSVRKSLGFFTGREFHEGLFSSPSSNAAQAASATSSADNAEIGQEEQYVNASEGNLRSAIGALGPNPYFQPPAAPAKVDPANTTNFFTPTPGNNSKGVPVPPPSTPPPTNLFAAAPQRQAQPAQRAPAATAQ